MPHAHPLATDLAAIEALRRHPELVASEEIWALYDDIRMRLAMLRLPGHVATAVESHESRARHMLEHFLNGELPPQTFWAGLRELLEKLDALASRDRLEEAKLAERAVAGWRSRLDDTHLAPTLREALLSTIELMATTCLAFQEGRMEADAFWAVFEEGEVAINHAISAVKQDAQEAWAHAMVQEALDLDSPDNLKGAIAHRLARLAEAGRRGETVPEAEVEAIDRLLQEASAIKECINRGATRYRALYEAVRHADIGPAALGAAVAHLSAMHDLLVAVEGGTISPEEFEASFALEAVRLESHLHQQPTLQPW